MFEFHRDLFANQAIIAIVEDHTGGSSQSKKWSNKENLFRRCKQNVRFNIPEDRKS